MPSNKTKSDPYGHGSYTPVLARLDGETLSRLDAAAERMALSRAEVIRLALADWLRRAEKKIRKST